jgi:hypothetical protein
MLLLRKSQFAKLEAAWNNEVLTLDMAIAVTLDTADKTELARLRASREASKAKLDAARRAEVARVEKAWCAEVAKHEAATRPWLVDQGANFVSTAVSEGGSQLSALLSLRDGEKWC